MDEDRPLAGCGNLHLANKKPLLRLVRRTLVIVIEADFAAGNHFRLSQQPIELSQGSFIRLMGIVRIDSGAGVESWQFLRPDASPLNWRADLQRLLHLRRSLADADGKHRAYTG